LNGCSVENEVFVYMSKYDTQATYFRI